MTWEPDYITSAELKTELRISDSDDDAQVARWVTAASRSVDNFAHRQFGKVASSETRTYLAEYDRHVGCYVVEIDDLCSVTGLVVMSGTTAITDYTMYPLNALVKGKVYERVHLSVGGTLTFATDQWGWSAVPTSVKQGTFLQATRLAARRDSPYGVAGSPSEGSEMRLLARVDPDVETVIGKKYRREWWAA